MWHDVVEDKLWKSWSWQPRWHGDDWKGTSDGEDFKGSSLNRDGLQLIAVALPLQVTFSVCLFS